jgi:hypothetical protein
LADFATDLFGISGATATTLAGETATQAITTLLGDSYSDLLGYLKLMRDLKSDDENDFLEPSSFVRLLSGFQHSRLGTSGGVYPVADGDRERQTMSVRKIVVVGGFAVGAALTFAPLATADDLTTTVTSEIAAANDAFQTDTFLTGNYADVVYHTGSFDTILAADAPVSGASWLDSVLYGVDPAEAEPSAVPGAYDVSDGALLQFDDAYNVEAYSLLNAGALVPAADLFGPSTTITEALATVSVQGAFTTFLDQGLTDTLEYFGIFAPG